jgi:hypothetical protein
VSNDPHEQPSDVWVLETQTKGTGANVVPLDRALKPARPVPGFNIRKPVPREPEPPVQREPYRFKVVDVMTREPLAEDVDARVAVQALEAVRSIVDVIVYVWEPDTERWRLLSFGETQALWDHRRSTARSRS